MNRTEKEKYVEDIRDKFRRANATFLAEYRGMKAIEMNEFRRALREAGVEFRVVRNTLARRAIGGTPSERLSERLNGPVAVAFSFRDAALAAKKLTAFAKDSPSLKFMGGTLGPRLLVAEDIKRLAELPSREVLIGMLLGSMNSPIAGFVGVLGGVHRKLLYALNAVASKKSG